MALSAFDDKAHEPRTAELSQVLGPAAELWARLVSGIRSALDPLDEDWTFSGKKWGWALRLRHRRRAVLYLTPADGFFHAGFALGQKAVDAAHESGLPKAVLDAIDGSRRYAEGRAVRLEVRSQEDVDNAVLLATIKMGR